MNPSTDMATAILAVRTASLLTKAHLLKHISRDTNQTSNGGVAASSKQDKSEVTIADFAAQAVLISIVHQAFPDDEFLAEESSDMLRENGDLADRVYALMTSAQIYLDEEKSKVLPKSKDEMLEIIDLGKTKGPMSEKRRWILDPIDGTRTYMRGHQYAVCLCLVEKSEQKVAVLGCPNLKIEQDTQGRNKIEEELVDLDPEGGYLVCAMKNEGVKLLPIKQGDELSAAKHVPFAKTSSTTEKMIFTDSQASPHTTQTVHGDVFRHFGCAKALDIWSMQLKYIVLALGAADSMIRVPPDPEYHASVWDHAGGQLIFQECGGKLTDAKGQDYALGLGRTLERNWGVVATLPLSDKSADEIHHLVLESVEKELAARSKT